MTNFLDKIDFLGANIFLLFSICLIVLLSISKRTLSQKVSICLKLLPVYIFLIMLQITYALLICLDDMPSIRKVFYINLSAAIFTIFEYCIFAFILSRLIRLNLLRKYLVFSCVLFFITAIMCWYFVPSYGKAVSIITSAECISLIPFCLYYFFELLNNSSLLKLAAQPGFWIVTGMLCLLICVAPFYLAFNYLKNMPQMEMIDFLGYDVIVLFLAKASTLNMTTIND